MADAQWEIDVFIYDDIDAEMRDGMQRLVDETAEKALDVARDFVPNLRTSRGYATGALELIGYTVSISGTGYPEAKAKAVAQPKSRLGVRNQVLPEYNIHQLDLSNTNMAFAVMDFPTTYASLIRYGFKHVGKKGKSKKVIGIDYVTSAVNRVDAGMQTEARKLIKQVVDKPRG